MAGIPTGPCAHHRGRHSAAETFTAIEAPARNTHATPTTPEDHVKRTRCASTRAHTDQPCRRGRDRPPHPRVPRASRSAHRYTRCPVGTPRPRQATPPGAPRAVGAPRPPTPARDGRELNHRSLRQVIASPGHDRNRADDIRRLPPRSSDRRSPATPPLWATSTTPSAPSPVDRLPVLGVLICEPTQLSA